MTRRPGRPGLFLAAAGVVVASSAVLALAGALPPWDAANNAFQTVLALGVAHIALRDQDRDTAKIMRAEGAMVRANPAVPNALAPDVEDGP